MFQDILKFLLSTVDVPSTILFVTMFLLVWVLAEWHKDGSAFDFRQALLDPETKAISFSRLGHFVCLVSSTGLLLHEAAKGRMTEWLFIGYMTAWAGTFVASKAIDAKYAPPPPAPPGAVKDAG